MKLLKKHIVIATSEFPPQPGGIGNHAYHLALYLSKNEYKVTVIADQRSPSGQEESVFDRSLPFSIHRIRWRTPRIIMYVDRMVSVLKVLKTADVLMATGKFSLWMFAALRSVKKLPTLAIIHGTEVNFKSYVLKTSVDMALKQFDAIVAVSQYTKSLVAHLEREVTVIPNGIDMSLWQQDTFNNRSLKGSPVLTTVGRVSFRKGQLNVIKHLPSLIEKFPEIHYHCVGIPTEAESFNQVAENLGVLRHITFHGSVSDNRLKQLLSETDIFIMLSAEDPSGDIEGFGIAILEANAMGIPAIGAKGCGIEDAINPHYSGELVAFDDSQQLVKALETITAQKQTYQAHATTWAMQHDWSTIIQRYITLIECPV